MPHTCVGPLELGPKNIVIGVPLIVVGMPEPQTALGVGMLLDVALIGHEQVLLMGCEDMTIAFDGRPLLPARKDEITPGMAATPCNEDVGMAEVQAAGAGGHDGQTGQGEDELGGSEGMVTTCTVGGGGSAAELEFVGGQGDDELLGGGAAIPVPMICIAGGADAGAGGGGIGTEALVLCGGGRGVAALGGGAGIIIIVTVTVTLFCCVCICVCVTVFPVPWMVIVCSLPPTMTVDAGPFKPGVKPATTPGVLVRAGGGAAAAGGGGGGAPA